MSSQFCSIWAGWPSRFQIPLAWGEIVRFTNVPFFHQVCGGRGGSGRRTSLDGEAWLSKESDPIHGNESMAHAAHSSCFLTQLMLRGAWLVRRRVCKALVRFAKRTPLQRAVAYHLAAYLPVGWALRCNVGLTTFRCKLVDVEDWTHINDVNFSYILIEVYSSRLVWT